MHATQQRRDASNSEDPDTLFKYSIFSWNGKDACPMVKASVITKGLELNSLLSQGKDHVMKVLFSGGVIRGKKIQRGSVYTFSDIVQWGGSEQRDGSSSLPEEKVLAQYEAINLLKFIVPMQQSAVKKIQQAKFPKFNNEFDSSSRTSPSTDTGSSYWSHFECIDDDGEGVMEVD